MPSLYTGSIPELVDIVCRCICIWLLLLDFCMYVTAEYRSWWFSLISGWCGINESVGAHVSDADVDCKVGEMICIALHEHIDPCTCHQHMHSIGTTGLYILPAPFTGTAATFRLRL